MIAVLLESPPRESAFRGAITYCGRLVATKGIATIIQTWLELESELGSACPPLWIIGGTPDEILRLRMQTQERVTLLAHERSGRLIWWGYQAPSGFSALLLRTLVLLSHSQYEPGGRVILNQWLNPSSRYPSKRPRRWRTAPRWATYSSCPSIRTSSTSSRSCSPSRLPVNPSARYPATPNTPSTSRRSAR